MRENRPHGSEGGEGETLPDPYRGCDANGSTVWAAGINTLTASGPSLEVLFRIGVTAGSASRIGRRGTVAPQALAAQQERADVVRAGTLRY